MWNVPPRPLQSHVRRVFGRLGLSVTGLSAILALAACDRGPEPSFQPDEDRTERGSATISAEGGDPAPSVAAEEAKPSAVGARHILITHTEATRAKPDVTRNKQEARSFAEELLGKARGEGADFQALAREHSSCPSAPKGGDLGTFRPGQMVPAFEQAAFALDVGEVSGVVETPFGFHIIQRYE
jgi:peptidyl-prolyl cis-trans isomerase NIMA-interacting 1